MRIALVATITSAVLSFVGMSNAVGETLQKDNAKKVQMLTAAELRALYSGKTWLWKKGAGYLASNGRFEAWSEESEPGYGVGTWTVRANGVMCFKTKWTSAKGSADTARCFAHARREDALYQRDEAVGHWYLFEHAVPLKNDGVNQIVTGNKIDRQLKAIEAKLAAKANQ